MFIKCKFLLKHMTLPFIFVNKILFILFMNSYCHSLHILIHRFGFPLISFFLCVCALRPVSILQKVSVHTHTHIYICGCKYIYKYAYSCIYVTDVCIIRRKHLPLCLPIRNYWDIAVSWLERWDHDTAISALPRRVQVFQSIYEIAWLTHIEIYWQ